MRKSFASSKPFRTLVEHRSAYTLDHAELNIYETRTYAESFGLQFPLPVIVSMISGKKVMHLRNRPAFDFHPGETIVMPSDEQMSIDFPEATLDKPTQCLALALSPDYIGETLHLLNEKMPRAEIHMPWKWVNDSFYCFNNGEVTATLGRLMHVFMQDHSAKHILGEHATQDLIIQLLQTNARYLLTHETARYTQQHRLAHVIRYVRENLSGRLNIAQLAEKACLSRAQFFRVFSNEMGTSPNEFILQERIRKAEELLTYSAKSITEISYETGFNSVSYFSQQFRRLSGRSPAAFRKVNLLQAR
ncbi:MAG: AraC family transcriptional regulator [Mucilaginibacter polytrichastri]|nr:AraC family transcriptional regulator [Mucilaginibacter polytrichastri]